MRSGLEDYAAEKLTAFRAGIKNRDRAVLIGATLSFIPIFPAFFFGAIVSLLNLISISKNRTSQRETRLVLISLAAGCLYSVLWIYLFISIGETFGFFLESILEIILAPFDFLYEAPTSHPTLRDLDV